MQDLFPPSVRLMISLFETDNWRPSSKAGRHALHTMLAGLPDTKCVEDAHQHLRDLQRKQRALASSKVCRTRACYLSPVLSGRGIPHRIVDKAFFVSKFRTKRALRTDGMFNARRHKWSDKWLRITDSRDWISRTPEASRKSLAAWSWLTIWWGLAKPRPRLVEPKLSIVVPELTVTEMPGEAPCVCVGTCHWGAGTLELAELGKPAVDGAPRSVWRVVGKVRWLHALNYKDARVIPRMLAHRSRSGLGCRLTCLASTWCRPLTRFRCSSTSSAGPSC